MGIRQGCFLGYLELQDVRGNTHAYLGKGDPLRASRCIPLGQRRLTKPVPDGQGQLSPPQHRLAVAPPIRARSCSPIPHDQRRLSAPLWTPLTMGGSDHSP